MQKLLVAVFLSILIAPAFGAATRMGSVSVTNTAGSYTAETGAINRIVALQACNQPTTTGTTPTVTAFSWGTNSLANGKMIQAQVANRIASNRVTCYLWYVKEADIQTGAQSFSITWSMTMTTTDTPIVARTLSGVNQTTPIDTSTGGAGLNFSSSDPWSGSIAVGNNTYQILIAAANNSTSSIPEASWTEVADANPGGIWTYMSHEKTTVTGATINWTLDFPNSQNGTVGIVSFASSTASSPTFSSAPAIGTRTTSSIPTLATTACTDCTYYGVAVTDGSGAPTCTQVKAGQNSGGTSAYKSFSQAMTANVQGTGTFDTYTDGTVRDGYFCLNSTAGGDSSVSSIADMYKNPAWTVNPTISAQTASAYTVSGTLDGAGTIYAVACIKDSTAATVTQTEAGNCTGNAAAQAAANKAVTGADTLTLGSALSLPIYDISVVGVYGSQHEAATHFLADEMLDCAAGKQCITLASVSATSWCADFNATQTPDIAAGDIIKIDSATTPDGFVWNQITDCNGNYSGTSARQSLQYDVYDTSAGAYMSGGPGTLWFNNQGPIGPEANSVRYNFRLNEAIDPINLVSLCLDPEGDSMTATNVSSLPTGLFVSSSQLQGTPTVRGYFPNLTFSCTDSTGETVEWQ